MRTYITTAIIAITAFIIASSCVPARYYQIGTIAPISKTAVQTSADNQLNYKDDNIEIYYDFWSENGKIKCIIHNTSDNDVTLHFDKSFLIKNDFAFDYFTNSIYSSESKNTWGEGATLNSTNASASAYNINSSSNVYAESLSATYGVSHISTQKNTIQTVERISIIIPAKSIKTVQKFNYLTDMYRDCDVFLFNFRKNKKTDMEFTTETTPLTFENRFVYTIVGDSTEHKINNSFYISKISNHKEEEFREEVDRDKNKCEDEIIPQPFANQIGMPKQTNSVSKTILPYKANRYYIEYQVKDFYKGTKH